MVKNLWKGKRGARDDAQRGDEETFPSAQPEYVSVGDTLRLRREERGEDLRYVAQMLRIRYPYLKAIEDGHPDELPGPTYAVGFVRTYSDHLGLSSEELVQRFKEEAANLQARADLHFPAPIPEGKIPSGAVLVIAVVLAAAVYGGWIYLSSQDQQVAEIVPQLPNRISEIIKGDPKTAPAAAGAVEESKQAAATASPEKPAEEKPEQIDGKQEADSAPPAGDTASDAAAATASSETPASTSADNTSGESSVASAEPTEGSESSIPTPPASDSDVSESSEPGSEVASAPALETPLSEGAESASPEFNTEPSAEADRAPPKTYGEQNAGARVVIQAAADSWVEVRDSGTDELLLTRVLFKGDRYLVPDRAGLTLLTGNAGGLRIIVDGSDVPPIGPLGAVRRNVLLEPSPLLAGNAARQSDNGSVRTQSQTSEGEFSAQ